MLRVKVISDQCPAPPAPRSPAERRAALSRVVVEAWRPGDGPRVSRSPSGGFWSGPVRVRFRTRAEDRRAERRSLPFDAASSTCSSTAFLHFAAATCVSSFFYGVPRKCSDGSSRSAALTPQTSRAARPAVGSRPSGPRGSDVCVDVQHRPRCPSRSSIARNVFILQQTRVCRSRRVPSSLSAGALLVRRGLTHLLPSCLPSVTS